MCIPLSYEINETNAVFKVKSFLSPQFLNSISHVLMVCLVFPLPLESGSAAIMNIETVCFLIHTVKKHFHHFLRVSSVFSFKTKVTGLREKVFVVVIEHRVIFRNNIPGGHRPEITVIYCVREYVCVGWCKGLCTCIRIKNRFV